MRLRLPNQISVFVCIACSLLYVVWSISRSFLSLRFLFLAFVCSLFFRSELAVVGNSLDTVEDYLMLSLVQSGAKQLESQSTITPVCM